MGDPAAAADSAGVAGGVNVTAIAVVVPLAGVALLAAALLVYLRVHRAARLRRRLAAGPQASVRQMSPVLIVDQLALRSDMQQQPHVAHEGSSRSVKFEALPFNKGK